MGRGQVEALWEKLKTPTAACMQDGAKTLARVWEAAWRAGAGETRTQGNKFKQSDLRTLYMKPDFLPAYPLQDVTLSADDRIIPVSVGAQPTRRPQAVAGRAAVKSGGGRRAKREKRKKAR